MRVTINESVNAPTALTVWEVEDFLTLYRNLEASFAYTNDKTDSDLLVPVAEWSKMHRLKANIIKHSPAFACDLDGLTEDQANAVFDKLDNTSCILYSTHSHLTEHKGGLHCYRILVELDREYEAKDFERVWRSVNRRLGGVLDPATLKHPELGYYLPSAPMGSTNHVLVLNEGRTWAVDALLEESPEEIPTPVKQQAASAAAPSGNALKLQMLKWGKTNEHGKIASAWLKGKNIVPLHEGKRNNILIAVAGYLAQQYPTVAPDALSDLFQGIGYDLFNADGKYPLERLTDAIDRMQSATKAEEAQARRKAVLKATGGDRESTLTQAEIQHLTDVYGDWTKHLIAVCGKAVYFLRPDGFYNSTPASMGKEFYAAVRDNLAVFQGHFDTHTEGPKGAAQKTVDAFLTDYSTVVDSVAYSYCDTTPAWDPYTKAIYLYVRRPKTEPKFHASIDRWLRAVDEPILLDMLAGMTNHSKPLPALILTGRRQTGKTLLADCCSHIYSSSPAEAHEAFGQYPAPSLRSCPIVKADEKLPKEYREFGTTKLRSFITSRVADYNEKFRPTTKIFGYLRVIVTANDASQVMATREEMSSEDREAFGERLVHVSMDKGAQVLAEIGSEKIGRDWIGNRHFAEHILWLAQNHKIANPGTRALVEQKPSEQNLPLAAMSGNFESVILWALMYLADPSKNRNPSLPVEIKGGTLRVHASAVLGSWKHYMQDAPPSLGAAGRALKAMDDLKSRSRVKNMLGYTIATRHLMQANEVHGIVDDLHKALSG